MGESRWTVGAVFTWIVIGILAIVALKILMRVVGFLIGVLGVLFGMAAFLVFTLGPIVLIGWLAMKAWKAFVREPAI